MLRCFSAFALASVLVGCVAAGRSADPVFPIIGSDPGGLVDTMEWGASPAATTSIGSGETVEILDTTTPTAVRIAVTGGGCPPTTQAQVTGPPEAVRIELILGGAIAPSGVECADILTTHELIVRFKEPIDLAGLRVSAERTGELPLG